MAVSEFGKGYATSLFQFANHAARLEEDLASYATLRETRPDPSFPDLWAETRAVELWANGASDHLYQLTQPRRLVKRETSRLAHRMAAQALDAGHGFNNRKYTPNMARNWLQIAEECLVDVGARVGFPILTIEDAMRADEALGLRPDKGQWPCGENITRRARLEAR